MKKNKNNLKAIKNENLRTIEYKGGLIGKIRGEEIREVTEAEIMYV